MMRLLSESVSAQVYCICSLKQVTSMPIPFAQSAATQQITCDIESF